jgi:hypothetical protein
MQAQERQDRCHCDCTARDPGRRQQPSDAHGAHPVSQHHDPQACGQVQPRSTYRPGDSSGGGRRIQAATPPRRHAGRRYRQGYASYLDELLAQRNLFNVEQSCWRCARICCSPRSACTARPAADGRAIEARPGARALRGEQRTVAVFNPKRSDNLFASAPVEQTTHRDEQVTRA